MNYRALRAARPTMRFPDVTPVKVRSSDFSARAQLRSQVSAAAMVVNTQVKNGIGSSEI